MAEGAWIEMVGNAAVVSVQLQARLPTKRRFPESCVYPPPSGQQMLRRNVVTGIMREGRKEPRTKQRVGRSQDTRPTALEETGGNGSIPVTSRSLISILISAVSKSQQRAETRS